MLDNIREQVAAAEAISEMPSSGGEGKGGS